MKKIRNVIAFLVAAVALVFTGGHALADDTGSITIQNAQVGQTYTLYKLFDATVGSNGAIAYTLPSGKTAANVATYFDVDSAGNVTAKSTTTESVVGSDAFKTWAKGFGTQVGSPVEATGNTVAFSGLSFGYYFVESSLGAALTIDSTNPTANVVDKNTSAPTIPSGGGKTADKTTAAIGDAVNYTVTFNATNYVVINNQGKPITKYTIVDTPTNLAIDASSVVVKVNGTEVSPSVKNVGTDGKLTVEIPWVDSSNNSLYSTPSEVTLTYSATVTTGAVKTDSLKGEASNTATISYNYGDNSGSITTNEVKVNTLGFGIRKVDGVSGNLLSGAEFKVYKTETSSEAIKFVKIADGYYRPATASEITAGTSIVEIIPAGAPYLVGFKDGDTFYIEETKAPAGYNKLTSRQSVTINGEGTTANVNNNKGTELPSTGSFGTRMLYIVGAAAILVASVYMVAKRRVKNL
ncbi:SpaA isopeptide-forming pilin-related protein [Streptococcus equinus]|uniref:SpaA isopeptide-forming pilin-related protein n=1 Tax=Streptococcus equinus TaxID=1335 RepID=UPI0008818D8B|nr:SpaA isopeptide-forming pilin-related protein [Streptococcus equinus]SDI92385.1 LPXTG-motif cell wall anchor domain-containing protein [Streptococcus equinus]SEP91099.1 LPXTG-motif cell wall anchor domain-containing protein [Streptococcus equinus]